MFQLRGTAALEFYRVTVGAKTSRIPETDRRLHAQLTFESSERGTSVQIPIAPSATREAILEEHADDGHHSEATIGNLGVQPALLLFWIGRATAPVDAKVSKGCLAEPLLIARKLARGVLRILFGSIHFA